MARGEPLAPSEGSGPATLSLAPVADDTTASPKSPAATAFGSLPDIPGYAVEAEIARGGMGVVYRARHFRLNRPAAIKMISAALADDERHPFRYHGTFTTVTR